MSTKSIGFVLIAIGVVVAAVSIFADRIGIGNQVQLAFGWKQQLGTAIGVVVALVGVWLALRKPALKK